MPKQDGGASAIMDVRRKVIFPLLAMLTGLTVGLFLVELLLRASGLAPVTKLHSVDSSEFERIPGIWQSNQDVVSTEVPALPHRVTTNSIGYRGEEIPVEKPEGELRILMTGDSFTFGAFVNNSETLPAQLEKKLRAKCGTNSIRVINAGLSGGTIIGQAEIIKRGLILEPDLVVLVFYENDIPDLRSPLWARMAHNRELKSRFPMNFLWPVLRNTATWNFGLKLKQLWRRRGWRSATVAKHTDDAVRAQHRRELRDLKALYLRTLLGTHKLVRQRNIEFVFLIYPDYSSLEGSDPLKLHSWAEQAGRSGGMPTFSLFEGMHEGLGAIERGFLLPHDGHPSPLGHEVAAGSSTQFLLSQEPLRQACHGLISAAR